MPIKMQKKNTLHYSRAEVTFVNFYKDDLDNVNEWHDGGEVDIHILSVW